MKTKRCARKGCDERARWGAKYCSQSCASTCRHKPMPRMTAAQFNAVGGLGTAKHSASGFLSPMVRAAVRHVIVGRKSQIEAAQLTGLSTQSVHHGVMRFLRRAGVVKPGQGRRDIP